MMSLEAAKKEIKELYQDIEEVAKMNSNDFYVMPLQMYNAIILKLGHLNDRLNRQTKAVKEMRRKLKLAQKSHKEDTR